MKVLMKIGEKPPVLANQIKLNNYKIIVTDQFTYKKSKTKS